MDPTQKPAWTIDGRRGEGGGQVLRTSLALSILCARPLVLENIRGGRKNPGLLAQHLCATNAAARVSNGHLEGARMGATALKFTPNVPQAGTYVFDVGTAGSASLVFQTIVYPLLAAGGRSEVTIGGGTHNLAAPPVPFLVSAFAPVVQRQGSVVDVELVRAGFFPKGGGEMRAHVHGGLPAQPLHLVERGKHVRTHATICVANLPPKVAREQTDALEGVLKLRPRAITVDERTESRGAGNAVFIEVEHENATEVFTGFSARGVRPVDVASRVAREAARYLKASHVVDEHLAYQLILPLVFGGGAFTTSTLARHSTTQIDLVRELIGAEIVVEEMGNKVIRVSVDRPVTAADLLAV